MKYSTARSMIESSRFYKLGAFTVRRRRWVLVGWLLLLVLAGPQLAKLQDRLSQGGFEVPGSQSDQVKRIIERDFKSQHQFNDLLVFKSNSLVATDPAYKDAVEKAVAALRSEPGVASLTDPYLSPERSISKDGHTVIASMALSDGQDAALKRDPKLESTLTSATKGSGVEGLLTGGAPFYRAFSETTTNDLKGAEKIALPISLVILILAFGSLVAAGMPVLVAVLSLAVSFGIISVVAANTTVSLFTENLASMIGIGVGIDYSLFILTRFREEQRLGRTVEDSVAMALATSGKAVFVSALTVAVALSGTLLVNLAAFRSMGFGAMIAVIVAGTASLTLLPAVLGMLGRRVDALSIKRSTKESGRLWHRWALIVMARPWIALVVSFGILLLLALPARDLVFGSSGPSVLPSDSGPRRALEITGAAFGAGEVGPVKVVIRGEANLLNEGFKTIYDLSASIATDKEVARVDSIATLAPGAPLEQARFAASSPQAAPFVSQLVARNGHETILSVVSHGSPQDRAVLSLVERLRDRIPALLPSGTHATVGGDPALNTDIDNEVKRKLPLVVALVLALSFVVLLLFLRSILLPLKAIIMNMASVLAAYGLLVFVFQQGHGAGLLSFSKVGYIESFLPLFLFCILFGLSMDYEVFLLARVREEYMVTGDNTEAVGWGLEHTARIITSAAAVMITVFGAFALTRLLPIKEMGFGLSVAVFLDATLIRLILVPATMRLMGKWNWWLPGWLDRLLPEFSLEAPVLLEPPAKEPAIT